MLLTTSQVIIFAGEKYWAIDVLKCFTISSASLFCSVIEVIIIESSCTRSDKSYQVSKYLD